jgi:hypothetical protein
MIEEMRLSRCRIFVGSLLFCATSETKSEAQYDDADADDDRPGANARGGAVEAQNNKKKQTKKNSLSMRNRTEVVGPSATRAAISDDVCSCAASLDSPTAAPIDKKDVQSHTT